MGHPLQYAGMIQIAAAPTRWRYIVECQDIDSGFIRAVVGSADTREECEAYALYEADLQRDLGRSVVNMEACELCLACDGDGVIIPRLPGAEQIRCRACAGRKGPFRRIRFGRKQRLLRPAYMYGT
jgi:hypothetical protein